MSEKQYRLLNVGEKINASRGDEVYVNGDWMIDNAFHGRCVMADWYPRRRPIEPVADDLRRQLSELRAALVEARGERDRVRAQRDEARASLDRRPKLEAAASTVARVLATGQTEVIDFDGGKVHIMRDDESRLMNGLLSVMEKAVDGEPQKFTTKAGFEFIVASAIKFDEMKAMRKKLQEAWDQVGHLQSQLDKGRYAAAHQPAEASPRERVVATLACGLVASGSEFDAKAVVRMADELIKEMAK